MYPLATELNPNTQPFSGVYTTDRAEYPTGPMYTSGQQSVGPIARGTPLQYIDVEFLNLKQTSPAQKEGLIQLSQSSDGAPAISADIYRTGVVNTHYAPGLKLRWGRWICEDRASEVAFFILDPFFYKREFLAATQSGGTFGGLTSLTVTFLPTNQALDWTKIYNQVEHWGVEANVKQKWMDTGRFSAIGLVGLRYHQLHERFNIDFAPVNATGFNESLDTGNDIFGIQVGAQGDWCVNEFVAVRGKANYLFGANFQWDSIKGPAAGTGFLTGTANLGYHDDVRVGHLGDFSLSVVAKLTPCIETTLGYSAMALGGVRRSAALLDLSNIGNPELKGGQDSLLLYGFTATVKVEF